MAAQATSLIAAATAGSVTRTSGLAPVARTVAVSAAAQQSIDDPSFVATGIPQAFHDRSKVAARWYWAGNPVMPNVTRMVITPNDSADTVRAHGGEPIILKGSRTLWESVTGTQAIVWSHIFMKPLYAYAYERLTDLMSFRESAKRAPDGGWAWTLKCIELCDTALRATNLTPALLIACTQRQLKAGDSTPLARLAKLWGTIGGLPASVKAWPFPLASLRTFDQSATAAIAANVEYAKQPERVWAKGTTDNLPETVYASSDLPTLPASTTWASVFKTQGASYVLSGTYGPPLLTANVSALAEHILATKFESWLVEGWSNYLTAMMGGFSLDGLPPRPWASMQDINDAIVGTKALTNAMAVAAVVAAASVLVSAASGNFKVMATQAVALFSMAFADDPPDPVSQVYPVYAPFRRVYPDGPLSLVPYPGTTGDVVTRMVEVSQNLVGVIPAPTTLPPTEQVIRGTKLSEFIDYRPEKKSSIWITVGVVGGIAALVVGIKILRRK